MIDDGIGLGFTIEIKSEECLMRLGVQPNKLLVKVGQKG
jgi:hypothetical protein